MGGELSRPRYRGMSLAETYALETGEAFEDYVRLALMDAGFTVSLTPRSHDGKRTCGQKRSTVALPGEASQVRQNPAAGGR